VVTWTATDAAGNTATATQTVTVVDTTAPSIIAPPDVTVEQTDRAGTPVALGSAAVSDICDADPEVTNNAPALFPLGETIVTWTARDDSGNAATDTQTVTVVDTTPPTITAPADVTVEQTDRAGTPVALGTPTVSDICDADPEVTDNAPAVFPLGETIVTWTATDDSGNTATDTQKVTVVDTTPPSIAAPADVTVEQTDRAGTPVALGSAAASDICDAEPQVTNNAPEVFPLGETTVTWTATDDSGNTATAQQKVTVEDTTPPTITAPPDVTVEQTDRAGTRVALGSAAASDICDAEPEVTINAPAVFPLGETIVTWTATDDSGNSATDTQTVTVVDTTPPSITAPADVTVEQTDRAGTPVALGSAAVSDICDADPEVTNDAPAVFPLGETTVTWTATDDSGNSATATQTVTVEDTTPPSITPPPDVTVEQTDRAGTPAVLGTPTVSDICDVEPEVSNNAPAVFPLGETSVTWTATDDSGNSATATQKVTVEDTTPPTIVAPPDIIAQETDPEGTPVDLGWPTVSDICDADPDVTNDAPALFLLGETIVTWTATDDSGNAATDTQKVTIVRLVATVTSPNGGEYLRGGGSHTITWTTSGGTPPITVDIDYSTNGGQSWTPIVLGMPDTGAYLWPRIPSVNSSTCLVRVTATDASAFSGSDTSDAEFTIDSTPPEIAIASVKQGGVELLGGPPAGRGLLAIQVTASDALSGLAGPPSVTLTFSDASTASATFVNQSPAGTFNYTFTATAATPNGACHVDAHVADRAGNGTDAAQREFSINVRVLTARVELEAYTGSPGAVLTLRFAFTDAGGTVLESRNVQVAYTNGRDTETVVLDQIPEGAVRVSCKEIQHFLRRRVDIGGTAPDLTAEFTGDDKLLGGDLKDDNFVELTDFAQFLRDFGKPNCPESDINGDGDVDTIEFGYIGLHFFQLGDPE